MNQMMKTFAKLDLSPLFSLDILRALVTLSYPEKDWEAVVPNGEVATRHREAFFRRFHRDWGEDLLCIWKREFTGQGVPHFHLYLKVPEGTAGQPARQAYEKRLTEWEEGKRASRPRWRKPSTFGLSFEQWAKKVWAEIVNHPDPAERAKHEEHGAHVKYSGGIEANTPRRMVAYLAKSLSSPYSAKGYQMKVPEQWKHSKETIGRTWGHRGLKKVVRTVQIPERDCIEISRLLRRMNRHVRLWDPEHKEHRVLPALRREWRPRGRVIGYERDAEGVLQPVQKKRRTTSRRKAMSGPNGAGYSLTSNGPGLARLLYRYLVAKTAPVTPTDQLPVGLRGPLHERLTPGAPTLVLVQALPGGPEGLSIAEGPFGGDRAGTPESAMGGAGRTPIEGQ